MPVLTHKNEKIVIVGAGLGGLFCGAILAKEGFRVSVLEKHYTAGGGLHTFKRHGQMFDTGMHYVSGFEEGNALRKMCDYLGITNQLDFTPFDPEAFDILRVKSDGAVYRFPLGEEAFIRRMSNYFPQQATQLKAYMKDLAAITDPVDMLHLRYSDQPASYQSGMGMEPLGGFMERHFTDQKLIGALLWNSSSYGGNKEYTPTYMHAVISRFFIKGATRFSYGAQQLADALADTIRAHGGEVCLRSEVCRAEISDDKSMKTLRLKSGELIEGDYFISTVHPAVSLSWFPESAFSKIFRSRIGGQKHTDSTFSLFITLKPERFPFINSNLFYACDYKDICSPPQWEKDGPRMIMAFMPPAGKAGEFARSLKISAITSFDDFRKWENTIPGQRGEEYEACKRKYAAALLARSVELFPDLPGAIETISAASPLSYQYYTGSVDGSNYGFSKDCRDLNVSRLLPRTKIRNFFFSGQNLNMHGILGVPLSAVITCGELIGLEYLIKKMSGSS